MNWCFNASLAYLYTFYIQVHYNSTNFMMAITVQPNNSVLMF